MYKGVGHMFDDGNGELKLFAALHAESRAHAFFDKHLKKVDK